MGLSPELGRPLKACLLLYTFKRGVLSAVGHHLRFSLPAELLIETTETEVRLSVRVAVSELTLHGSVSERVDPKTVLSGAASPTVAPMTAADERKIVSAARTRVLDADHYPSCSWTGRLSTEAYQRAQACVDGELVLRGARHAQRVSLERSEGGVVGVSELKPSTWGIEPYSAMFGALRLEDRVIAALRLDSSVATSDRD